MLRVRRLRARVRCLHARSGGNGREGLTARPQAGDTLRDPVPHSKGDSMNAKRNCVAARARRRLLVGIVLAAGVFLAASPSASAATTATFSNGVLTVIGDNALNNITVSRDAAGTILVNGGAIPVIGGTPTVANTALIRIFGLGGNDTITLSEVNGALPAGQLYGGADNDTLTGGSGGDQLFGQAGNDSLLGKGGFDLMFG